MPRICCNTADDKPHAEGCPYAIGNGLNRPCATHSIRGCPSCGKVAKSPSHTSDNPPARASESGPFSVVPADSYFGPVVAMALAGGNHRICIVAAASPVSARQIADALNMLHGVRAGTAGIGAAAPLVEEISDIQEAADRANAAANADLAEHLDCQIQRLASFLRFESGYWHGDTGEMTAAQIVDATFAHLKRLHGWASESVRAAPTDAVEAAPGRDPDTVDECIGIVRQAAQEAPGACVTGAMAGIIIDRLKAHIGEVEAPEAERTTILPARFDARAAMTAPLADMSIGYPRVTVSLRGVGEPQTVDWPRSEAGRRHDRGWSTK